MPDPEESNPSDNFSFVDKRRVTETSESADVETIVDADLPVDEPEESAAEPEPEAPTSIYDVAAYCLGLLITEGFQRMGIIADPRTGKAIVDLPSARVAIDCVAALVTVLEEPSSTLPEPVKREMKRTLNDLRLNYIDRTRV